MTRDEIVAYEKAAAEWLPRPCASCGDKWPFDPNTGERGSWAWHGHFPESLCHRCLNVLNVPLVSAALSVYRKLAQVVKPS